MSFADESDPEVIFRLNAARCVEIARRMSNSVDKASLILMAQSWEALADQADKRRQTAVQPTTG